MYLLEQQQNSNTTLVKVKLKNIFPKQNGIFYSNTTLVKVKSGDTIKIYPGSINSNTTLVKVKYKYCV